MRGVILDAGPLVAFYCETEARHLWAVERFRELELPVLTCEPVITEAAYLIEEKRVSSELLRKAIKSGFLKIAFNLENEITVVDALCRKYRDIPMSLADACVVRMAEMNPNSVVMTLDAHFLFYRKHGRQVIPVILPS